MPSERWLDLASRRESAPGTHLGRNAALARLNGMQRLASCQGRPRVALVRTAAWRKGYMGRGEGGIQCLMVHDVTRPLLAAAGPWREKRDAVDTRSDRRNVGMGIRVQCGIGHSGHVLCGERADIAAIKMSALEDCSPTRWDASS